MPLEITARSKVPIENILEGNSIPTVISMGT
jgi:hypothetical protein